MSNSSKPSSKVHALAVGALVAVHHSVWFYMCEGFHYVVHDAVWDICVEESWHHAREILFTYVKF